MDSPSDLLFFIFVQNDIDNNTENQCASDRGDNDLADRHGHTADTRDEDNGYGEEVCVVFEVDLLDHLETGNRDEAVEGNANAAHDASGDGVKESNEGRYEGNHHCEDRGGGDGCYGSVSGDGDTTDGFTVGGVGATAEESAYNGADTVTEEGAVQTGIFEKVFFDNGGEVLVVCDMFSEYDESNGNVSNGNGSEVAPFEILEAVSRLEESEVGNCEEGLECDTVGNEAGEGSEVDDLECVNACDITDNGEYETNGITCENTDDEGDELGHFLTVGGAENDNDEGNHCADERNPSVGGHNECAIAVLGTVREYVLDSGGSEGKTDKSNGGTDNDGGHELIDPSNANESDNDSDNDVNETAEQSADEESEISETEAHGRSACECCGHGTDECEGRAEEYGAAEFGADLVNESTDTRAEECCGSRHTVTDDSGNGDGCSDDCEKLLECKDKHLTEARSVMNVIDKIFSHFFLLFFRKCSFSSHFLYFILSILSQSVE